MVTKTFSVDGQEIRERMRRVLGIMDFITSFTPDGTVIEFKFGHRNCVLPFESVLSDDTLHRAFKAEMHRHDNQELKYHEGMVELLRHAIERYTEA